MKQGFFQALGVTIYCSLIGILFWKGNEIFGRVDSYFGPLMFLMLFSVSVLICGLLVFYKPYLLFFDGKKKQAIEVVASTAVFLFSFVLVVFGILILS
jgi:amino acid permease